MAFDFSFLQDDDFSNVSVYEGGKEQGYQGPDLNQFVGGGGGASLDPNDYMPERRADDSGDVMEAGRSGIFGALLAGATTVAGVAMDNPYMVGGGGAAGKNYSEQYGRMNKSLLEEQRANRLADSAMMRQMNMARFQRDLTAEDRAKADQRYEQEFALKKSADERAGAAEGRAGELHEAQMAELNKTPEQKAQEQIQVMKLVAKAEQQINLEATAAQNAQQLNILQGNLQKLGVSEGTIQQASIQLMLKQAGIDTTKQAGKPFSGEQKVKLQQTAKEEYLARPENQTRLETEPAKVEAEADRHGVQTANAIEAQLNQGAGGSGLAAQIMAEVQSDKPAPGGGEAGKTQLGKAIAAYYKGDATAEQLMAGADTAEEKAAVQEAIQLMKREDADYGSVGALEQRLGAQAAAEEQAALQGQYEEAPTPLAQQAAVNTATAQGIEIDTGQTAKFDERQERTIGRYVDRYKAADAKGKADLIAKLRKNAPPELLAEVMNRVK